MVGVDFFLQADNYYFESHSFMGIDGGPTDVYNNNCICTAVWQYCAWLVFTKNYLRNISSYYH